MNSYSVQKMMKNIIVINFVLVCLVLCSILLTSCASVVTFVDQGGFEQTIEVNTTPENVSVIKNGKIIGETPLTISFSRKKTFLLRLKNKDIEPNISW